MAKIIHLIRYPVTLSSRRSHLTSRVNNPVGISVLKQAYEDLDIDFEAGSTNPVQINNATSWNNQLKKVKEFAMQNLNKTFILY